MNSGNIGERLRAARKEMGLTQTELAERLGISFVGVSQWESGKRNPKKETLVRLAAILDVPVSYFLDTENLDDEALDFLLRAWKHADYQLTALQHNGSSMWKLSVGSMYVTNSIHCTRKLRQSTRQNRKLCRTEQQK